MLLGEPQDELILFGCLKIKLTRYYLIFYETILPFSVSIAKQKKKNSSKRGGRARSIKIYIHAECILRWPPL